MNVQQVRGHEGEGLISGTLKVGRKVIGTYGEADYGGGAYITFSQGGEALLKEKKDEYYQFNPATDTSDLNFISELLMLLSLKEVFNGQKGTDKPAVAIFDFERRVTDTGLYPRKRTSFYTADSVKSLKKFAETEKPETVFYAEKLSDFDIKIK